MTIKSFMEKEVDVKRYASGVTNEWRVALLAFLLVFSLGALMIFVLIRPYTTILLVQPAVPPTYASSFKYFASPPEHPSVLKSFEQAIANEFSSHFDRVKTRPYKMPDTGRNVFQVELGGRGERFTRDELNEFLNLAETQMRQTLVDVFNQRLENKQKMIEVELSSLEREYKRLRTYSLQQIERYREKDSASDEESFDLWLYINGLQSLDNLTSSEVQFVGQRIEALTFNDFIMLQAQWISKYRSGFESGSISTGIAMRNALVQLDSYDAEWKSKGFLKGIIDEPKVQVLGGHLNTMLFNLLLASLLVAFIVASLKNTFAPRLSI